MYKLSLTQFENQLKTAAELTYKPANLFTQQQKDFFYEDHTGNRIHRFVNTAKNPKSFVKLIRAGLKEDVWGASGVVGAWLVLMGSFDYSEYTIEAEKLAPTIQKLASKYGTNIEWFQETYGNLEETDPASYTKIFQTMVGAWQILASALKAKKIPRLIPFRQADELWKGLPSRSSLEDKITPWWLEMARGSVVVIFKGGGYEFRKGYDGLKEEWLATAENPMVEAILWSGKSSDPLTFFVQYLSTLNEFYKLNQMSIPALKHHLLKNYKKYFEKYKIHTAKDWTFKYPKTSKKASQVDAQRIAKQAGSKGDWRLDGVGHSRYELAAEFFLPNDLEPRRVTDAIAQKVASAMGPGFQVKFGGATVPDRKPSREFIDMGLPDHHLLEPSTIWYLIYGP